MNRLTPPPHPRVVGVCLRLNPSSDFGLTIELGHTYTWYVWHGENWWSATGQGHPDELLFDVSEPPPESVLYVGRPVGDPAGLYFQEAPGGVLP